MTPEHQLRLASVTKSLSAILAWKLIELHKLKLHSVVNDFLRPGLVVNGNLITVGMLLNHTDGIYDAVDSFEFVDTFASRPYYSWSSGQILKISRAHGAVFPPGTAYRYGDTGYFVLGMMEKSAGRKKTNHLFQTLIGKPFKLKRTSLNYNGAITTKKHTPGYSYDGSEKGMISTNLWNFSWDRTAGSGLSCAKDMIALSSALMEKKVLSARTLKKMWTIVPPSHDFYGFEPFPFSSPYLWVSKVGSAPGTTTAWVMSPYQGYSIFVGFNFFDSTIPPKVDTNLIAYNTCISIIHTLGWK